MILSVDLFDNPLKDAFRIENKGFAECSHRHFAVVFLLTPRAKGLQHLRRRITHQRERQVVFLFELDMRGLTVLAHTKHLITLRKEGMVVVANVACYSRTSRSLVLWIEVNNGFLTDEVFVRDHFAGFVCCRKTRHLVSNL